MTLSSEAAAFITSPMFASRFPENGLNDETASLAFLAASRSVKYPVSKPEKCPVGRLIETEIAPEVPIRIYVPQGEGPFAVMLYFHGGGWVAGELDQYDLTCRIFSKSANLVVINVGYRLAPEHPFPQPVEDCVAAYRWLLEEGVAPERIAFFGDSAGGNLCLAAGLLAARDGIPLPAAMVLASPAPDLTFSGPSNVAKRDVDPFSRIDNPARMVEYYLRGADPRDPLASPVFADLTGFPPLLIMVGPDETLVDDCHALAERATKCGVDTELQVVEGAFHTWLGYAGVIPEADDCITRIGTFIAKHTRGTL